METTARNRTIGGIVIGAIILILLLVLFSCTVSGGDPESSPTKEPTTGESSLPSDPDTLEPDEDPSESESDDPEEIDGDDIVPAANTGVTFIPAGNIPSASTPTCEVDKSACEPVRPPNAGVDICEIRPDLTQCQPPVEPTPPPTEPTDPPTEEPTECELFPWLPQCDDGEEPGPGDPDENAPDAVTVSPCVVNSNTSVTIDWSEARDKSGISHYTVTSRPNAGDPGETDRTSATFNDLRAGDTYRFWVTATDKAGNESEDSNEVECVMDVTAPQVPQDVTVEEGDPSDSTLDVSWSESEDNTDGVGNVTYNLYRNGQLVGPVNGTSYEDTGLTPGTTYTYSVSAVDGAGNESARSAGVDGTTTKIAPTVPTGLDANGEGAGGFTLTWDPSTDQDKATPAAEIDYRVDVDGGLCFGGTVTGETTYQVRCILWDTTVVTVTAIDGDDNESAPSRALTVYASGEAPAPAPGLRSSTPGEEKSDGPGETPAPSDDPANEAPAEKPTDEKSPELPGLGDLLPGGEDTAEAPAEEPAEPEAPAGSEAPAERPTVEEPAEEPAEEAPADEAPAEKDEGGLLENIGDALSSAVAAVF